MTAHSRDNARPTNDLGRCGSPADRDNAPRLAADVPIAVWRLDDHDDQSGSGASFAAKLARRLVLIYTSQGQTVVTFDHDADLYQATAATGRGYLAIADASFLADLDQLDQPVTLVTLRWPRHTDPAAQPIPDELVADMFRASRLFAAPEATVVAAVRPVPEQDGGTFADHEHLLRRAAQTAGLRHILQIVAVSEAGDGDQYLYNCTAADAAREAEAAKQRGPALHIDLLVFTRAQHRHG